MLRCLRYLISDLSHRIRLLFNSELRCYYRCYDECYDAFCDSVFRSLVGVTDDRIISGMGEYFRCVGKCENTCASVCFK